MKRRWLSAAVVVLLLVAVLAPLALYASGEWTTVGSRGFSAGNALYVSAAVNSANVPYVAFRDDGLGGKAVLMTFDLATGWGLVGNAPISSGAAEYVSLAIGGDDIPYVAYQDGSSSEKVTVRGFFTNTWQTVGTAGFSAGKADYISLAVDSNDVPFVAFQDYSDNVDLRRGVVKKWTGSEWTDVGTSSFSPSGAQYISLALDSNNVPYVAFKDGESLDKVKKLDNNAWTEIGSPGFSSGYAYYVSLVLGRNNAPYVAYRDGSNLNRVTVKQFDGNEWQVVGTEGDYFYAGSVKYYNISLAMDRNGVPNVAFQDSAKSNEVTVIRLDVDGNAWQPVGTAGFSDSTAENISMAIGGNGTLFVAYRDSGADYKSTVQSYANPLAVTLVSFDAVWQGESVLVAWETAQELDNLGFNLYRAQDAEGPWARLNGDLIPAQQPGAIFGAVYEWVDEGVIPGEPVYYWLEDVDIHGVSTFHGPIAAQTPAPSAVTVKAFGAGGLPPVLVLGLAGAGMAWGWMRRRN